MRKLNLPPLDGGVIFRRYRRVRGSTRILDAHDYGLEAWPIRIRNKRK